MKRRIFLSLAPAVIAARPVPASPVHLPTIQEQMDEHAAAMCKIVRSIAPEDTGGIAVTVGDNWTVPYMLGQSWSAQAFVYRNEPMPNGKDFWVGRGGWHLNPNNLRRS